MKIHLILLTCALSLQTYAARHFVVVVPPLLPAQVRDDAARLSARLLYESVPGTRVTVFDAARMNTVADIVVPPGTLKLRQAAAMPQITNVAAVVRGASDSSRFFDVPNILDYVGRQLRGDGEELMVVLMGPAIYRNPKEPAYDMSSKWPSDTHLVVPRNQSIFSTLDRSNVLENVAVSWFVSDANAVANDTHGDGLSRFWSLYIATQGGVLTGYAPDLVNAFSLARDGRQAPYRMVQVQRGESALEMHAALQSPAAAPKSVPTPVRIMTVTNVVNETNIVTLTNRLVELRDSPFPATSPGKTRIGLVWLTPRGTSQCIDLDLHVQVPFDGAELSFINARTPHGRYFRDVREAANEAKDGNWAATWEAVELDGNQLPREVWVHIYSGRGPCQGELRVLYQGAEHRVAFAFPAVRGDSNATPSRRETSDRWLRIDLTFLNSGR